MNKICLAEDPKLSALQNYEEAAFHAMADNPEIEAFKTAHDAARKALLKYAREIGLIKE